MSLTMVVGMLADLLKDSEADSEDIDFTKEQLTQLNAVLAESGLRPHKEPTDIEYWNLTVRYEGYILLQQEARRLFEEGKLAGIDEATLKHLTDNNMADSMWVPADFEPVLHVPRDDEDDDGDEDDEDDDDAEPFDGGGGLDDADEAEDDELPFDLPDLSMLDIGSSARLKRVCEAVIKAVGFAKDPNKFEIDGSGDGEEITDWVAEWGAGPPLRDEDTQTLLYMALAAHQACRVSLDGKAVILYV